MHRIPQIRAVSGIDQWWTCDETIKSRQRGRNPRRHTVFAATFYATLGLIHSAVITTFKTPSLSVRSTPSHSPSVEGGLLVLRFWDAGTIRSPDNQKETPSETRFTKETEKETAATSQNGIFEAKAGLHSWSPAGFGKDAGLSVIPC